jgi:hypothetical protein
LLDLQQIQLSNLNFEDVEYSVSIGIDAVQRALEVGDHSWQGLDLTIV